MTGTSYGRNPHGSRPFYFDILDQSALSCGTDILINSVDTGTSFSSGTVQPGSSQSWSWNNLAANTVYLPGLDPTVPDSGQCRFQVTRTGYTQLTSGARKLTFTIRNTGAVACATDIELARLPG